MIMQYPMRNFALNLIFAAKDVCGGSFKMQVNYRERASALGKTLHGNKRRETVTERENWAAAIIDRVLRPHFPRGLFRALQVANSSACQKCAFFTGEIIVSL